MIYRLIRKELYRGQKTEGWGTFEGPVFILSETNVLIVCLSVLFAYLPPSQTRIARRTLNQSRRAWGRMKRPRLGENILAGFTSSRREFVQGARFESWMLQHRFTLGTQ